MSNYHVEPIHESQALTSEAIKSLRHSQVQGISRRRLLRITLGGTLALWITVIVCGRLSTFFRPCVCGPGEALVFLIYCIPV